MKLYSFFSFFPASRSVHKQGRGGSASRHPRGDWHLLAMGLSLRKMTSFDLNFLFSPVRTFLALKTSSCYLRVKAAVFQGVPTASFSSMAPGRT